MMKKVLFFSITMLFFLVSFSQEEGEGFQKDRLFVGGNFGLSFGDQILVNISPVVGYRFSELFAAGLGINGQYVSVKSYYQDGSPYTKTSQGVFGLNVFGRIFPIKHIMLQVQPEANYIFGNQTFYGPPEQRYKMDAMIVPSFLVGAGAVFPSGNGSFMVSYFYDVLQKANSPYGGQPFLTFGYNVSLQ
jgi:hypothetical protein